MTDFPPSTRNFSLIIFIQGLCLVVVVEFGLAPVGELLEGEDLLRVFYPSSFYLLPGFLRAEDHGRQRRQLQRNGVWASVSGHSLRLYPALSAGAASAVGGGIGVEDHVVASTLGDPDAVGVVHHRGEVADHDGKISLAVPADEREYAVLAISALDPLEARGVEVYFVEGWCLSVEAVEVAHQGADA